MLAKAGVDVQALECGAHWPYQDGATRELARRRTPSALHNNCSGKHSGFVCLGCQLNGGRADLRGFLSGYVKPEHPVMRRSAPRCRPPPAGTCRAARAAPTAAASPRTPCRCATWRWPLRAWPPARA
jgi:hypothetical protein